MSFLSLPKIGNADIYVITKHPFIWQLAFVGQLRDQQLLNAIGARLKKLREKKQLSQEVVYNDTGIHVARIEVGKVNISVSTLAALCRYYGFDIREVFSD